MGKNDDTLFYGQYYTHVDIIRSIFLFGCFNSKRINNILKISESKYGHAIKKIESYMQADNTLIRKKELHFEENLPDIIDIPRDDSCTVLMKYNRDEYSNYFINLYRLCKSEAKDLYAYASILLGIGEKSGGDPRKIGAVRDYFGKSLSSDNSPVALTDKNKITKDEFYELYDALCFYREKAPYGVPGYFACDRIAAYDSDNIYKDPFMFKNDNIVKILNNNYVYSILNAVRLGKWIKFEYKPLLRDTVTEECIFPLKVLREYLVGREYVIGIAAENGNETVKTFRIDYISRPEYTDGDVPALAGKQESIIEKTIISVFSSNLINKVKVRFRSGSKRMKELIPVGEIRDFSDSGSVWEADVYDDISIIPFIRRFGGNAVIDEETAKMNCDDDGKNVFDNVKNDLIRALENYGEQ